MIENEEDVKIYLRGVFDIMKDKDYLFEDFVLKIKLNWKNIIFSNLFINKFFTNIWFVLNKIFVYSVYYPFKAPFIFLDKYFIYQNNILSVDCW